MQLVRRACICVHVMLYMRPCPVTFHIIHAISKACLYMCTCHVTFHIHVYEQSVSNFIYMYMSFHIHVYEQSVPNMCKVSQVRAYHTSLFVRYTYVYIYTLYVYVYGVSCLNARIEHLLNLCIVPCRRLCVYTCTNVHEHTDREGHRHSRIHASTCVWHIHLHPI